MENQGDGDFEVTAEMLIHGDLDDESTLSDEEDVDEGESDELDELQNEGELPLEMLLARYGYGGGPSGVKSVLSDSSDSGDEVGGGPRKAVVGGASDGAGPSTSRVSDKTNDLPDVKLETASGQDVHVDNDTPQANANSSPKKDEISNNHSLHQKDKTQENKTNSVESHPLPVNSDPELKAGKVERSSLGKRRGDPVVKDVMLTSKRRALLTDTNEATSSSHWIRSGRLRRDLPERRAARHVTEGSMVEAYFSTLMEDSGGSDDEFRPLLREDWKQDIKVGAQYQANVPECRQSVAPPTPYKATPTGVLKWRPRESSDQTVTKFLTGLSQIESTAHYDSERDNEEALEVLEKCNHDVPTAMEKVCSQGLPKRVMEPWSETECQSFEEGLRTYGKNFYRIQKQVPTRPVKELIEFYYIWKKSERNDLFVQQYGKIGKKKVNVPAGHISDFMNKCLDVYNSDSPDVHYAATTISAESKRDNT